MPGCFRSPLPIAPLLGRHLLAVGLAVARAVAGVHGAELDFEVVTHDQIEFVRIPAGSFVMGTTEAQRSHLLDSKAWSRFEECELPAHAVTISRPFLLSKCEITQRQWKLVVGQNPSAFKGDNLPVEMVSWEDVQGYLRKLNDHSKAKYRLPTEAEWEYCCRAGSTNLFGLGPGEEAVAREHLACYAWYRAVADNKTHRVGEKKPNAWGLHDMHGNLWEWCQDYYASAFYLTSPSADPLNRETAPERVLRGGSWFLDWPNLRAAYRSGNLPELRSQYVGFRLVRETE